jgi:hypothetical protein
MSEEQGIDEQPAGDETAVRRLLADARIWDDPPDGVDDALVAAIEAARSSLPPPDRDGTSTPVVSAIEADRRSLRSATPWWLGAAAAIALIVTGVALIVRGGSTPDDGLLVALAPSDTAADASGTAWVSATPAGLRIVIDVEDLPAAPADSYYEAWLSDGSIPISCGTFHLRDGDEPIELWAGVTDPAFDRLAITLEPIDDDAGSSGDVRLSGRFEMADVTGWDG